MWRIFCQAVFLSTISPFKAVCVVSNVITSPGYTIAVSVGESTQVCKIGWFGKNAADFVNEFLLSVSSLEAFSFPLTSSSSFLALFSVSFFFSSFSSSASFLAFIKALTMPAQSSFNFSFPFVLFYLFRLKFPCHKGCRYEVCFQGFLHIL